MGSVEDMRVFTGDITEVIAEYWQSLETVEPLGKEKEPGFLLNTLPLEAPENPDKWEDVVADVQELILPGVCHASSPRFHAYVELGCSAPSVAATQLMAAISSPALKWHTNPASTELEMRTTDWLARMIGLPDEFIFSSGKGNGGGVIHESASGTVILTLLAAKFRVLKELRRNDPDLDPYEASLKFVALTSDQAHSSVERAGLITGIRYEILETDEEGSLRGHTVQEAADRLKAEGKIPLYLAVTLGTTTSCAFDNMAEIGPVCRNEGIWMHVDAAICGSMFICPEFRYLLDGVHFADSFNCSPQKTLHVNQNCSVYWVKDRETVEHSLAVHPPYLADEINKPYVDYRNWSFNLCRPFRSLKLWFVMRLFGAKGLKSHIRKNVGLLNEFVDLMKEDERFEVTNKVVYSTVCFRLKNVNDETNLKLLTKINDAKEIYITSSVFKGTFVLRFAISTALTESRHVKLAWQQITRAASEMDLQNNNVPKKT